MNVNQQEIFDKVASHLITQGVQATYRPLINQGDSYPSCAYRGDNGTMCAAGCLIPDEEYEKDFESLSWAMVAYKIPSLASLTSADHGLISTLQGVHDWAGVWESIESLKNELRTVATNYGLSTDILN